MKNFDVVAKFPEVSAAVVSDSSGAILEWSGDIDGEAAGAVHSFSMQSLAQAGELLGLGGLERASIVGPTKACVIAVQGDEVLGVYSLPGKAFSAVEKKLDVALRH
ncbi:MAG TPA: hypothetical protein VK841_07440 [Polyangiaceae bacterium]|jgi:hypothetical protein|nr:hypothetical protein [Polyangiaceae bacterium]